MRNFAKKFPVLRKLRKKIAQNHANSLRFMRKSSQKKFAQKQHKFYAKHLAISWKPQAELGVRFYSDTSKAV